MEIRRKLYSRGSSFETTIPRPLLFDMEPGMKYVVAFQYDHEKKRWYVIIEKDEAQKDRRRMV
ncbi:MAG: hypothetical protein ABIJ21_03800 [Nanoarchaeota archaeon]